MSDRYLHDYEAEGPGHDHVHGANLGARTDIYWRVGGFAAMASGKDVDLVERFDKAGYSIRRDERLSVATSDRRIGRAPGGSADHLRAVARTMLNQTACDPA
jgi:hypothetical protein